MQNRERVLIESLRANGAVDGLIGRVAGARVKILPSTIYWHGLGRWQVLTRDVAPDQLDQRSGPASEADELVTTTSSEWHAGLPSPPDGFPDEVPGGFALTEGEASWLTERIVASCAGSLLAHLVVAPQPPDPEAAAPWDEPLAMSATGELVEWLDHARRFSTVMRGAALLYNLLVAEAYEQAGLDQVERPVERYRLDLAEWADDVDTGLGELSRWDRTAMRIQVSGQNPQIKARTWSFVDDWIDTVVDVRGRLIDHRGARGLVANRERAQKGRQSRLANERLLATWSGASGARPLTYRWGTARTIVTDIIDGRRVL